MIRIDRIHEKGKFGGFHKNNNNGNTVNNSNNNIASSDQKVNVPVKKSSS